MGARLARCFRSSRAAERGSRAASQQPLNAECYESAVKTCTVSERACSATGAKALNGYCKVRTLSRGRRGEKVSLYRCHASGELVAIKSAPRGTPWRARLGNQEDAAATAALREASALKHLHHPHIVRLLELIDDPSHPKLFLVLEHLGGGPIYTSENDVNGVPSHHLPIERVRTCILHLLLGLHHMHSIGYAHLDIKPSNMRCTEDGCVKIIDFELAVSLTEQTQPNSLGSNAGGTLPAQTRHSHCDGVIDSAVSSSSDVLQNADLDSDCTAHAERQQRYGRSEQHWKKKKRTRRTPGTPAFTAPECAAGKSFSPSKADIWAAGVTLHLMLLFSYPINPGATLLETYRRIRSSSVHVPQSVASQPQGDLLCKLLRRDQSRRLSAAEALRHPFLTQEGAHGERGADGHCSG